MGNTCRHLHQRVDEHIKNSVIGKHMKEVHQESTDHIDNCFSVLKKCCGKYECLLYEMLGCMFGFKFLSWGWSGMALWLMSQNKEICRRATQWCNVSPFFYAKIMQYLARMRSSQPVQRVYWPFCWLTCIYLAGVMADSMRDAICVATQTSKVPTRVALLYISLFCAYVLRHGKTY